MSWVVGCLGGSKRRSGRLGHREAFCTFWGSVRPAHNLVTAPTALSRHLSFTWRDQLTTRCWGLHGPPFLILSSSSRILCNQNVKIQDCRGKSSCQKKKTFHQQLDFCLRRKLVQCYIRNVALYGAETWTLRNVEQKCLECIEIRCWGGTRTISWTHRVRNELLHKVIGERNILSTRTRRNSTGLVTSCLGSAF